MEAHAQGPSLAARRKARSAQPPAAANPVAHRENFRHLETQLSFSLYAMDRACQSQTPSSSRGDCLQRQTLLASAKGVSDGTGLAGGVAKPLLCKARDRGAIAPRGAILHQKPRKLPTFARRFKPPRSASTLPRAPVSFHVKRDRHRSRNILVRLTLDMIVHKQGAAMVFWRDLLSGSR